nr:immunoglobulin light chain junction region [Macaca mulatta]
CQQVYRDPLTF